LRVGLADGSANEKLLLPIPLPISLESERADGDERDRKTAITSTTMTLTTSWMVYPAGCEGGRMWRRDFVFGHVDGSSEETKECPKVTKHFHADVNLDLVHMCPRTAQDSSLMSFQKTGTSVAPFHDWIINTYMR
jgi:hypothetical protein